MAQNTMALYYYQHMQHTCLLKIGVQSQVRSLSPKEMNLSGIIIQE
jgi:hypothetical protein